MKLLSQNKTLLLVVTLILLLAMNYNTVNFGIENDCIGIVFSILLFVVGSRKTNFKVNYFVVTLLLIFEFVSYRLHTKSLHFLALLLLACLIYYNFTKKFSYVAFICILLFSSIFNKFFEHLTTEIKQTLCYGVYLTLKNFMTIDRIEGVNFYLNGAKITIDTACMGLSMFKTGLLTGAILLSLEERKNKKYFSVVQIVVFCNLIIILNIISNYFRIVTLILLQCTQENVLHHTVGMLCFIVYQVLPMLWIIRYFQPKKEEIIVTNTKSNTLVSVLMIAVIFVTSLEMKKEKNDDILQGLNPKYKIETGKWIGPEVFKIETPNKLIYIKTPSHKPLICWTGNGYKIIQTKEVSIENQKIWYNVMEKNNIKYASYWWYECGNKKYTSFVEVMFMKLLYNKPIRLINETSVLK
ncbi:exosortase N [Flavobacterium sp.]|uniref:exosortase N n=1 Tax=Flavobacterium sp. TaxID=239 RepID=UPI0037528FE3